MRKNSAKFVFVTGGVLSGLGKGVTAASIGNILKARGLKVNIQKLDPYLNVDSGTLNPAEHGECFVTKDGAETDLDLGHYERFLDVELTQSSSIMSGRILRELIEAERNGAFLGKTVQLMPHFVNAIKDQVIKAAKGYDVHIVEIGGTVGDYESPAFFEAIRQLGVESGPDNHINVQVVYLPYLGASGEIKTKPAQNAMRNLRALGIQPNIIAARSEDMPAADVRAKLAAFGGIEKESIVVLPNAKSIYEVPLTLEKAGIGKAIITKLKLKSKRRVSFKDWRKAVDRYTKTYSKTIKVGMVAKYLDNDDTYMSVIEAVNSSAYSSGVKAEITWIDAEKLKGKESLKALDELDGIIIPGGFGSRGVEGKILAADYAIENEIPYLGLCLGMQVATVAVARRAGLEANSLEVDPKTSCPVIYIMSGQEDKTETGGTMRLGDYKCELEKGTLARKLYGKKSVLERHRHRYEFNNKYRAKLEKQGLVVSGASPDGKLVEVVEMKDHPFFIASQYHPEFKASPLKPHPLFDGFIQAAIDKA